MYIIGQPKCLAELEPVPAEEIAGLAAFLDQQIREGTPLEIPQAMPLRDMARMIRTIQVLQEEVQKLAAAQEQARPKLVLLED